MTKSKSSESKKLSAHSRNMDNIMLLVSHKPFQDIVEETRTYLDIPENGIQAGSDLEVWYDKHHQKSNNKLADADFLTEVDVIRKQRKESQDIELDLKKHYDQVPINFFKNRIDFIIEVFNLPDHYADHIRMYILTNEVTAPAQNFVTSAYISPHASGERYVNVKVYTRLSNNDLKQLGTWINNAVGTQLPEFQKLKDIDTRIKMEQWYKDRRKCDTLEESYYEMSAAEIAENITGNASDKNRVRDSIRKLEELRKSRFGK